MWPLIIAAIAGAALGAKKNKDAQAQNKTDRYVQAATEANSPWTGMHGTAVKGTPSATTDIAGGAIGGAGFGQSIQSGMNADEMQASQKDYMNSQTGVNNAQANYYNNANRDSMIAQNQGGNTSSMNGMNMQNGQMGYVPWSPYGPMPANKQQSQSSMPNFFASNQ